MSSEELWQRYTTAQSSQQMDHTFDTFAAYLAKWVESGEKTVTPSPMISSTCDLYGNLKPCMAFEISDDVWMLEEQPPDMLKALQGHVDGLTEKLLAGSLCKELGTEPANDVLKQAQNCSLALVRVAGCRDNYHLLSRSNIIQSTVVLMQALLDLFKWSPSLVSMRVIVKTLRQCVGFFHQVVDPRRIWQRRFMHVRNVAMFAADKIIAVSSEVPDIFVTVFNHRWDDIVTGEGKEAWLDLQLDVLHMMGALLSSSMVNRELASSEKACLLLLTLFDPREQCTSTQVLATKVFVEMVHVLHSSLAENEVGVDSSMMLVTFLNVLSPRYHEENLINPCIRMVITLLDAVPNLLDSEECKMKMLDSSTTMSESLKRLFVEMGCYEKVCEVLHLVEEEECEKDEDECRQLVCSIFKAFSAVTRNCPSTRQDFEHRVQGSWLFDTIAKFITPTEQVLQEALNMVVEGEYTFKDKGHTVFNMSAMKMVIYWLPTLPHPLQLWLASRLLDMCSCGSHNRQRCCIGGTVTAFLNTITGSQLPGRYFKQDVEDILIDTVEVLCTHSIRTGELKQLVGALRPLEEGTLPTYYYRLLKSLTAMAECGSKGVAPLYYFDLRSDDAHIAIPELKQFPTSSSLSFHIWVLLDSTQKHSPTDSMASFEQNGDNGKRKRILYSFYTNGGTGFEAFFVDTSPTTCMLVVATVTKKEFITLSLKEFSLETNNWYSISIVYSVPKRPWSRSEVQIYVNGEVKKIANIRTPNFSDNFTSCIIGFGPSRGNPPRTREVTPPISSSHSTAESTSDGGVSDDSVSSATLLSTSLGEVVWKWGKVTNLNGLISSFTVFGDTLNASSFTALHEKGPNDLSLFQYKCSETYELGNKLILYYHAKSVQKGSCLNLAPLYGGVKDRLDGVFTGQNYITWDIKAVLGSLGGVELLFPVLEQVSLSVTSRHAPNDDHTPNDPSTSLRWFGESEGVAAFLKLLIAMLSNNKTNQNGFLHYEGPATIAALLLKTPPIMLTVSTFHKIQELVELFSDDEHSRADIYKHLIFDFRVWSRPSYSVRIGHIQYISNIVRNQAEWRPIYGMQYILDVIRVFYCNQNTVTSNDMVKLEEEERLSMRAALLMILKYHLMSGVQLEEVEGVLAFTAVTTDIVLQEELLNILRNLLLKSECGRELGQAMWSRGHFLLSLIRAPSMPVRLIVIKIVSHLLSRYMDVSGPLTTAFKEGSMAAAIGHMTEPDMSSVIVLALTDLCVAKDTTSYTDYISDIPVFMSMLHLLRQAPLNVRNTLCQLINSILHHTPEDILQLSSLPGWEVAFLYLLTPSQHAPLSNTTPSTVVVHTTPSEGIPNGEETTPPRRFPVAATPPKSSLVRPQHLNVCRETDSTHTQDHTPSVEPEGSPKSPPRSRLRAFADENTASKKGSFIITKDKELMDAKNSSRKKSLRVSTPWAAVGVEEGMEEEVMRTVDIVSQIIRIILWNSTIDSTPWKVWGKFFCQFDKFKQGKELLVPPAIFKQKLLTLLCHDVTMELKEGMDSGQSLQKLLYLSQQLEMFVITTYPSNTTSEDREVSLIKLAHNFFPEIDIRHYNRGLQEEYLKMLMSAGIFDKEVAFNMQEIEISQSASRILLGCLASGNKEYYVTASLRLEHMLKCPFLTMKDVCFIFSNLARIAQMAIEEDDSDWLQYVASILRCLFTFNFSRLKLEEHLSQLPDYRTPDFGIGFAQYCTTAEWKDYMNGALKTAEVEYSDVLMRWLVEREDRKKECSKSAISEDEGRRRVAVDNEMKYQRVLLMINDMLSEEVKRQRSADSQQRNELLVTLQKWRNTRRFFTGERGAWSSRKPEEYLWKLDRTENFSRMRMRLARNFNFTRHKDASKMRDTGMTLDHTPTKDQAAAELLAKVTKRTSSSYEEEEVLLEQLWSDANSSSLRGEGLEEAGAGKERKYIKGVECHLIMLMDSISGHLEITSHHLYFLSDQLEKNQNHTWYSTDFKIPLSHMREIHSRRYNMSRTSLEIFLVDQTNYFINFPNKKVMNMVYRTILDLRPPNLNRVGIRKPARLLRESGLTNKWVKREISNFDYLMQLNTISGRTYNDLNQYPVFPWVLNDYNSKELDLTDESVFRDFSRPVGIQNHALEENVRLRYEEFDDPTLGKFHFGSHYSNAAGVMHYLVRLEPFTSLHIELQSGRFDFADRQFFSIPSTWANIYKSGTDQKELIPEFFYLPEFLKNINGLDLGKLQSGSVLDHVVLPSWASSAEEFIVKHREALESEYVSAHLHEWIDLIFGHKQTGPEAVKACNIFNFYTYEENVNLDSIKDPKERRQIESIINNFGQTPTQLFTDPHPQRLPVESARKAQAKGFTATLTGRRQLVNLFSNLSLLKAHSVDVCQDPVVFVGTPAIQTKALLVSGNPEQLVTVNKHGLLNIHGWLPFSNSKNRPFTFQFDPNAHFDRSRWQFVGGPFAQDIAVKSNLFVLSPNNKYIVSAGHWDNSFRVHLVEKGKISARVTHHNDVVTCMALDKAGVGDHLITGSRDTSCAIWKFGVNGIQSHPLQTLYGHASEVLCVAISTELDLALSGARDGTCLLHTVRQGLYIHTLHPRQGLKCEIHLLAISNTGLVIYSEDTSHRQRLIGSVPPCLHLYTVNGALLLEKELVECINVMIVIDKYLVTGNTRGYLTFRNLFTLQQCHSLNLLESIHCISVVLDHHSRMCTHLLVGLANGKLIIVSVKDMPSAGTKQN